MKTILAAIDFSDSSYNAAKYAADLAADIHANLVLVNVVQFPAAASEAAVSEQVYEEMINLAQNDLENIATKLADRIDHKVSIDTELQVGTVEYQIEVVAGKYKPIAIVMGIRAGRNLERLILGSHALFTLRHSHFPVLIIPQDCQFNGFKNIGLATDLNDVKSDPVESIRRHLSAFDASLHVVHVSKHASKVISQPANEPIALANQLSGLRPKFYFVENEDISDGLHEFCDQQHLNLLIIIPKEHGLLDLFSEKHSNKIATHMNIPVLAISPQQVETIPYSTIL